MLIELARVSKSSAGKNPVQLLKEINLRLSAGQILLLRGRSGSGKSTLLNIIAGQTLASEGSVSVCGYDLNKIAWRALPEFRRKVIYLDETHNLFPRLSLLDNCLAALDIARVVVKNPVQHVAQALSQAQFSNFNQRCSTLSGEASVRAALARSSIVNPRVLLCDGLLQRLDYEDTEIIVEQLTRLRRRGTTIILSNNNQLPENLKVDYTLTLDNEPTPIMQRML